MADVDASFTAKSLSRGTNETSSNVTYGTVLDGDCEGFSTRKPLGVRIGLAIFLGITPLPLPRKFLRKIHFYETYIFSQL